MHGMLCVITFSCSSPPGAHLPLSPAVGRPSESTACAGPVGTLAFVPPTVPLSVVAVAPPTGPPAVPPPPDDVPPPPTLPEAVPVPVPVPLAPVPVSAPGVDDSDPAATPVVEPSLLACTTWVLFFGVTVSSTSCSATMARNGA